MGFTGGRGVGELLPLASASALVSSFCESLLPSLVRVFQSCWNSGFLCGILLGRGNSFEDPPPSSPLDIQGDHDQQLARDRKLRLDISLSFVGFSLNSFFGLRGLGGSAALQWASGGDRPLPTFQLLYWGSGICRRSCRVPYIQSRAFSSIREGVT